ncbi:MAG: HAMP domain-containing sensor histidine kinase [Jaaginema sp. PMC 1079.18]|nr:HAMP domain-containing sensor histidine kinase [Jaaginema sp. PMC 1080.18]MEC4853386.1 HAMP domain-containing sensor histidine kinase [Jaaginema sp. PMC 1079.18]MEC4867997.1 HAMP domain-containing sensor histidine kinase [Jaaginema sp. PMC 1078.18]
MVLGTGLIPTSNPQFRRLRRRLLLSYLGVILGVTGISAIAVYQMVAQSLYQQVDDRLLTVAQTGAKSLALVKHEYREHEEDGFEAEDDEPETEKQPNRNSSKYSRFLNIATVPLPNRALGVEWFDEQGKLLIREGNLFPAGLFVPIQSRYGDYSQENGNRSLIFPVFLLESQNKRELAGYIRATESLQGIEQELSRLRWGLSLGGVLALFLAGIGGIMLTNQALRPIEQSFEQLRQFTADASHELRSPLTAIKAAVFLLQNRDGEDRHNAIATIDSATAQMKILVEDLLLLARLDRDRHTPHLDWIDLPLDEILEDILNAITAPAQQKQIGIQAEIAPNLTVKGQGALLKRVFVNLIENALHYTPKGGKITVRSYQSDRQAWVSIQDTGIGIAPEQLPHIFDRFWRGDKARDRRKGGMGLGLAIAQSLAIAHNGQITVTSQPNIGSCFQVRLPLA